MHNDFFAVKLVVAIVNHFHDASLFILSNNFSDEIKWFVIVF